MLSKCLTIDLKNKQRASPTLNTNVPQLEKAVCFLSLVSFITLIPYNQGDETGNAPNCTLEKKEKEKLHSTMTESFVSSL